jgi:predicted TPR repeat methyltransferase
MSNSADLLLKARELLDRGQLSQARELFTSVCDLDDSNAEAWLMLGAIDAEAGRMDEALSHTQRALALDPDYEEAHLTLAGLQQHQGQLEGALLSCASALSIDSDYEEAWLMQSGIQGALGQYIDSEESSRQALRLWPECVDAHVNLGNALKAQSQWDAAIDSYRQALQLQPGQAGVFAGIGSALLGNGNAEGAIEDFEQSLALDPENKEATLGIGSALVILGQLDEAATYSGKALDYYPENAEAHFIRGRILHDKGDMDEAVTCYKKALDFNPEHARTNFYLGAIFHEKEELDQALGYYQAAVRIKPDFMQAHFSMGIIYQLQRQLEQAIHHYKESVKYYREIAENADISNAAIVNAYCQLGYIYGLLMDNRDEAVSYYSMALELDPEHERAKHYLVSLGEGEAPERASDGYVADLFDAMSDDFDNMLVGTLEYKTPECLYEAVKQALPDTDNKLDILDLGCGTGLCGPVFNDISAFMAGVDLSPKMVAKARERKLYDILEAAELTEFMHNSDRQYSLVLSADVFVYIGNLGEVFAACANILEQGGLFAFSTEVAADEEQDFVLGKSGRYAHSMRYIKNLAQQQNFTEVSFNNTVIRKEGGQPVSGMIVVLKKD